MDVGRKVLPLGPTRTAGWSLGSARVDPNSGASDVVIPDLLAVYQECLFCEKLLRCKLNNIWAFLMYASLKMFFKKLYSLEKDNEVMVLEIIKCFCCLSYLN